MFSQYEELKQDQSRRQFFRVRDSAFTDEAIGAI